MATIKPPTKAQIEASNNYKREKEILRDIHKIDVAIQNADPAEMESLHRYLNGKYQYGIADWGKSMYGYVDGHGFKYEWLGADSIKDNLSTMKPKLEAFMHGWNAKSSSAGSVRNPDVNVTVNNTVNISISFEETRHKIEDMTALSREQTDEILEKSTSWKKSRRKTLPVKPSGKRSSTLLLLHWTKVQMWPSPFCHWLCR